MRQISRDPAKGRYFQREALCQSLAENSVELVTISGNDDGDSEDESEDDNNTRAQRRRRRELATAKKYIVISARVHPSEAVASWMCRGMLHFLTGDSASAAVLRRYFIFKVVPMINPDGVYNGHYRMDLFN